jgi:hypothetical protein
MWLFLKLRNQIMATIRAGLNDGIEMEVNGERWLIERVAPDASFFIDVGANVGIGHLHFWMQAIMKNLKACSLNPRLKRFLYYLIMYGVL